MEKHPAPVVAKSQLQKTSSRDRGARFDVLAPFSFPQGGQLSLWCTMLEELPRRHPVEFCVAMPTLMAVGTKGKSRESEPNLAVFLRSAKSGVSFVPTPWPGRRARRHRRPAGGSQNFGGPGRTAGTRAHCSWCKCYFMFPGRATSSDLGCRKSRGISRRSRRRTARLLRETGRFCGTGGSLTSGSIA